MKSEVREPKTLAAWFYNNRSAHHVPRYDKELSEIQQASLSCC